MKKCIYLLSVIALLATGCNGSNNNNDNKNNNDDDKNNPSDDSTTKTDPTSNKLLNFNDANFDTRKIGSKEDVTSDDLFNLGNKIDISISISDEELNKLQDDYNTGYKSEIYHVADLVTIKLTNYENTFIWEYKNVGIRQKGNTSRNNILVDGEINTKNHYKLSFDETFDDVTRYSTSFIEEMKTKMDGESYEDRDFLSLSGLDFKWNRNEDTTYIKEVYASYLYKAGGIIAQNVGLSTLTMIQEDNDNKSYSFGLCTMYEPAKKSLIKKSFQNNTNYLNAPTWKEEKKGTYGVSDANYGDLYKCTWGVGEGGNNTGSSMTLSSISNKKVGVGNITGSYIPTYERKTNTDVDYDNTLLKDAFTAFSSSDYSDLSNYVDLEYLAKVSAINYFIGNPDDYRYNYNNYMIYFRRVDKKMIIIPIDNDRVLGITKGMNFENGNTESKPYSKNTFAGEQKNPLLLKTILSSSKNQCKEDYKNIIISLASSTWAKSTTFNKYMNIAKTTYTDYTFNKTNENMSISTYFSKKISTINKELNSNITVEDTSSDEKSEDTTVYDNLYIVGNFNNWGNYSDSDLSKYKFNYLGDYTYSITIDITNTLDDNTLQFKINGGKQDYSTIDWSFNGDLTKLKKEKAGNAILADVNKGDQISIRFNTNTLDSEVKNLSKE